MRLTNDVGSLIPKGASRYAKVAFIATFWGSLMIVRSRSLAAAPLPTCMPVRVPLALCDDLMNSLAAQRVLII